MISSRQINRNPVNQNNRTDKHAKQNKIYNNLNQNNKISKKRTKKRPKKRT